MEKKVKYEGNTYIVYYGDLALENYLKSKNKTIKEIQLKKWITDKKDKPVSNRSVIRGILEKLVKSQ